jgi:UDP-2,3-diacylglucosamine hydrolase
VFIDRLMRCEDEIPNLSWHRYYVRLGDSVFLHGDVVDRPMGAKGLARARSRRLHDTASGPRLDRLYDLFVRANLHRPVVRLRRRKKTAARRILSYLEDIGQGPSNGVRNVYFGHTHRAFSDYEYGGMIFHNSGAPMKGLEFRILEVST